MMGGNVQQFLYIQGDIMAVEDQIIALNRELGVMQGKVVAMDNRITGLEEDIDRRLAGIETTLNDVSSILNQQKGGLRVLIAVGSLFGSIGAVLGYFLQHFVK
jgi:hypothetical protein